MIGSNNRNEDSETYLDEKVIREIKTTASLAI